MQRFNPSRLNHTLLAAAGGVVLTCSLLFAHLMGQQSIVNTKQLTLILVVFWLINFGLITAVVLPSLSHIFKEPLFSKGLIRWSSFCCFVALSMATDYQELFYFSLFGNIVFAVLMFSPQDFRRYAQFIIVMQLLQCSAAHYLGSSDNSLIENISLLAALGAVIGIMGFLCKSVTQLRNNLRQRNSELQQALIAKDQFLANMNHELRTPMNGVIGMLQLLGTTQLDQTQRKYIDLAQTSGNSLITLINDILDFSKIKQDSLHLEQREVSLPQLIRKLAGSFYYQAKQKHVEILLDMDPDIPEQLIGDEVRLTQIFNNLLSNAVKFTNRGSITLQLRSELETDQCHLLCTVSDTGIGIDATAKGEIFKEFTQADSGTTRDYGGTGLGLTIARQLIKLMGGDISVDSQPEQGSIFSFDFYLDYNRDAPAQRKPLLDGVQVDLIDESVAHQNIVSKYLSHLGAQVRCLSYAELKDIAKTEAGDDLKNRVLAIHAEGASYEEHQPLLKSLSTVLWKTLIFFSDQKPQGFHEASLFLEKPIDFSSLYSVLENIQARSGEPAEQQEQSQKNNVVSILRKDTRVLVVEDNPINQEVTRAMLNKIGLTAEIVNNGAEAVERIRQPQKPFDLILMDCQTPVLDGYKATKIIREGGAGISHQHIPIIAITANTQPADRERCIDAGMDDYLPKPFSLSLLKETVEKYLNS